MKIWWALPGELAVGLKNSKWTQEGYLADVLNECLFLILYVVVFHSVVYWSFVSGIYVTSRTNFKRYVFGSPSFFFRSLVRSMYLLVFLRFATSAFFSKLTVSSKRIIFLLLACLLTLYMRHCKLAHQSQSQNCATFQSHFWSILWII